MFDVRRNERLARAAGAAGFVSKQDGSEKLIATVHEVLKAGKGHDEALKPISGNQTGLLQRKTNNKPKET